MKKIILSLITILMLVSCKDKYLNVNNIKIEPRFGKDEVIVSWEIPQECDYEFIEINYSVNDEQNTNFKTEKVRDITRLLIKNFQYDTPYIFTFTTHYSEGNKSYTTTKNISGFKDTRPPKAIVINDYFYDGDYVTFNIVPLEKSVNEVVINIEKKYKSSKFLGKREIGNDYLKLYVEDLGNIEDIYSFEFYSIGYLKKFSPKTVIENKYKKTVWEKYFVDAIANNDVETFNKQLEEQPLPFYEYKEHPMTIAIKKSNWDQIKFMLKTKMSLEFLDNEDHGFPTFLTKAIYSNDIETATFLVNNGYKFSEESFAIAIEHGDYELVKQMLDNGANPDSFIGGREVFAPYVSYKSMLEVASKNKRDRIYDLLIERGADPLYPSSGYDQFIQMEETVELDKGSLHRWRTPEVVSLEDDENLTYEEAITYWPRMLIEPLASVEVYDNPELKGEPELSIDAGELIAVMTLTVKKTETQDSKALIYMISETNKRGWISGHKLKWVK